MKINLVIIFSIFIFSGYSQTISVAAFKALPTDMSAKIDAPKIDKNGDKCAIIKVVTSETNFSWDLGSIGMVAAEKKIGEYWLYVPHGAKKITIMHNQLGVLREYYFPEAIKEASVYEMRLTTKKVTTIVEDVKISKQYLIIKTKPDSADVYINEKFIGKTPIHQKYEEGDYNYRIELYRYKPVAGKVTIGSEKKQLSFVLKPKFGDLKVSSHPEDGMAVFIDGKPTNKVTPVTLTGIDFGEHTISLKNKWYQVQKKSVVVSDTKPNFVFFSLKALFASITINADVGSVIFVDDQDVNKSGETNTSSSDGYNKFGIPKKVNSSNNSVYTGNWEGRLLEGSYDIRIEKDKYYPQEKQIKVKIGDNIKLDFELKAKTGDLDITSVPAGAIVKLDGKKYGETPCTVNELLIGKYNLTLESSGYTTIKKEITVLHDEEVVIKNEFKKKIIKHKYTVKINSSPKGAKVYIDGLYVGRTPCQKSIDIGTHNIKAILKDETREQKIEVNSNSMKQLHYYFTKKDRVGFDDIYSSVNDGPANAFVSMIVPGIGVENVTHGEKKGWKRSAWVYGLMGVALSFEVGSKINYGMYHNATNQVDMDKYYSKAINNHSTAHTFFTFGLLYWTYNVLWVAYKGNQNRPVFGFNYNPNYNSVSLSYKYNF